MLHYLIAPIQHILGSIPEFLVLIQELFYAVLPNVVGMRFRVFPG